MSATAINHRSILSLHYSTSLPIILSVGFQSLIMKGMHVIRRDSVTKASGRFTKWVSVCGLAFAFELLKVNTIHTFPPSLLVFRSAFPSVKLGLFETFKTVFGDISKTESRAAFVGNEIEVEKVPQCPIAVHAKAY